MTDVGETTARGAGRAGSPEAGEAIAAQAAAGVAQSADTSQAGCADAGCHVFISYRHADTAAQAFLLHDRLKRRFGESNVFLDIAALKPGMDWREAIHARANACGVLIVLIGVKWLSLMKESAQRNLVEPVDDVARQELEIALRNNGNIDVLPVLVDGATMPAAHELPTTLQRLTDRQAERLELVSYDQDVERLMERLVTLSSEPRSRPQPEGHSDRAAPLSASATASGPVARLAGLITGNGHVAAVLGSGVNRGLKVLPDSQRLATMLAGQFGYQAEAEKPHLSEVAQYVEATWGRPDLHRTLTESFGAAEEVGQVHLFLAGLQAKLHAAGLPRRPFLALTTNFDTALERAFHDAGEPFHLAIYMANTGRFVHIRPDGSQREIDEPNRYSDFPIEDDLRLSSMLIVKLHGAIGQRELGYNDAENYVITEDNYIDYLSGSSVEQIIPVQILQKLKASHCVFMGYDIADWSLRVLLKRVWGSRIPAKSWAVQPDAHEFEEVLWRESGVELIDRPLDAFVTDLDAQLRQAQ
jgi:hypothetical protein